MRLSLVIPCYNEAKNLPALFERCKELVSQAEVEVVLVDNGSTDATSQVLGKLIDETIPIRVVKVVENKGYGHGIIKGLEQCSGDFIGWTHADLQTDPLDALKAIQLINNDAGRGGAFIKGTRYGRPFADRLFTFGMSVFETVILKSWLRDINAQPTIFPREFFLSWEDAPDDFSLDLFAYYCAKRGGLQVCRFPVEFGERLYGVSHWNINFREKLKFISRTINYSFALKERLRK